MTSVHEFKVSLGKYPVSEIHSTKRIVRPVLPFWSTVIAKGQCREECPCLTPHITSSAQPLPLVHDLLSPGVFSCWPLCLNTFSSSAQAAISPLYLSSNVSLLRVISPRISEVAPKPHFEASQTFLLLQSHCSTFHRVPVSLSVRFRAKACQG